jgi:hypothetical protein
VINMTAARAFELGLFDTVTCIDVPALETRLRGVLGVDCNRLGTSLFRFVPDRAYQTSPTRIMD